MDDPVLQELHQHFASLLTFNDGQHDRRPTPGDPQWTSL